MTQALVTGKLKALYLRRLSTRLLSQAALLFASCLLLLLVLVLLDAIIGLPVYALYISKILVLGAISGSFGWMVFTTIQHRYEPLALARDLEEAHGRDDAPLLNALSLTEHPDGGSDSLRQLAIQRGMDIAKQLDIGPAMDHRPLWRTLAMGMASIIIVGGAYLISPRMFNTGMARIWSPHSGVPAYTRVGFDIEVNPNPVMEGDSSTITVQLSGMGLPDHADIVFEDDHRGVWRYPMLRVGQDRYQWVHEQARENLRFHVVTDLGRSRDYDLEVLPKPRLKNLHVTLDYPDYTGWPSQNERLDSGTLQALRGTKVTIFAEANHALKSGELKLLTKNGQTQLITLKPQPQAGHVVTGSFILDQDGHYELQLTDHRDLKLDQLIRHSMIVHADGLPSVSVIEPQQHIIAPVNWKVTVKIKATDDIGVHALQLRRGVNGWSESVMPLIMDRPDHVEVKASHTFDLNALGASAGDVITYTLVAEDANPFGPGRDVTEPYVIRVVSKEEYAEYARQNYRMKQVRAEWTDIANRLTQLDLLRREILKGLNKVDQQIVANNNQIGIDQKNSLLKNHELVNKYEKDMDELINLLITRMNRPDIYEFDEQYKAWLQNIYQHLEDEADDLNDFRKTHAWIEDEQPMNGPFDEYRQDLKKLLERILQEIEEIQLQPEKIKEMNEQLLLLELIEAMQDELQAIVSIADQQARLAKRLDRLSLRENPDAATQLRLRQVAEDQLNLRNQLDAVLNNLGSLADNAQDILPQAAKSVMEIVVAIDDMKVLKDMLDASRLAKAGEGQYAAFSARQASDKLETLIPKAENPPFGGGGGGGEKGPLDGPLGLNRQSMQRLLRQMNNRNNNQNNRGQGQGTGRSQSSRAKYQVTGLPQTGNLNPDGSNQGGGLGRGSTEEEASGLAERLNPGIHRKVEGSGTGEGQSTPDKYRDQVDAYFRRLGDDSKEQQNP